MILNRQRREIEADMQESALLKLEELLKTRQTEIQMNYSICLFDARLASGCDRYSGLAHQGQASPPGDHFCTRQ
jgi:hypothetical protein